MRPQVTADITSQTESPWLFPDFEISSFSLGLAVEIDSGSNLTAKVEYTLVNPKDGTPTAEQIFDDATLVSLTASAAGSQTTPVYGVRLNVTAYTTGTARLRLLQGGRS